jgi:hypothetical protein
MTWRIDEHGHLVISISAREQNSLDRQRGNPGFDSDDLMHRMLGSLTKKGLAWLDPDCTDDITSAPMLGILGEAMPGPDDLQDAVGMGLVYIGWQKGRQMYRPVLKRWAFMDYAVTSPQAVLAETGQCVWDGGEFWGTQEAAEKAIGEVVGCGEKMPHKPY